MLSREIYNLLTDGGILINIEHIVSATPEVQKLYDGLFIDYLAIHNKRDRQDVAMEYQSNKLERVDIQINWLREIGFNQSDCYFKWFELAVFGGVK